MAECGWSLRSERSGRNGAHDAPEHVLSMWGVLLYPRGVLAGAVPGTQKTHDGQGWGTFFTSA